MRTGIFLALWLAIALPAGLASAQTGGRQDPVPPPSAGGGQAPNPAGNPDAQQLERSSPEATLDLLRRMQRARESSAPTTGR
jgi:hypothetical protein